MATYYIYRKNVPGTLSPLMLQEYAKAFRLLYCSPLLPGKPRLEIIIRGTWLTGIKDGLFLDGGAIVTSIGRKFVTIEYKMEGKTEQRQVELTPNKREGFSEIMFIDIYS